MSGCSMPFALCLLALCCPAGLTACGGDPSAVTERDPDLGKTGTGATLPKGLGGRNRKNGTLFGPGGLFGSKAREEGHFRNAAWP